MDGNGQISIVDVFLVAQHLGKKRFDPRYDINRDGRVDGRDLQFVLRAMGRIC